ncbi:MAG: hypothetical protein Q9169_007385 [Polycauliona sp. 2 TL-2023]
MEPLSITASVITVLQVTNKAVGFLVTLSNAPKEKSSLIDEFKNIRKKLEDLAQLSSNGDSAAKAQLPTLKRVTDLKDKSSPLARCNMEVEALNVSLASTSGWAPEGSKRNEAIQRLKWPFKDKEVSKVLERLASCRGELTSALSVDQTNLTLNLHRSVQTLADRTSIIHDDNRYRQLYEWLRAPDSSINHNAARQKWVKSTGDWFLQSWQYADWRSGPRSLIWLHGIPGCGKTVLSSTIIDDMRMRCNQNQGKGLAYFYFDFNNPQNDGSKMLRSLVSQLSTQDSAALSLLAELHSSCEPAQSTDDALLAVLKKMVNVFPQIYIVLDALDECKSRAILLEAIEDIVAWQHEGLRMLVTSRYEGDLKESLEPLVKESGTMDIRSAAMDEDIRNYIWTRLSDRSPLKRWQKHPEVQEEIVAYLMAKADGTFRLVECQLDALQKCLNLSALREALKTLPPTLYATYEQILCNINHPQDAFRAFQWLSYSEQPLGPEELVDVLAIDAENEPRFDADRRLTEQEDILSICSSLITISHEDHSYKPRTIVKLAHFSVKEYLISQDILQGPASGYAIDCQSAQTAIGEDCIMYLIDTTPETDYSDRNPFPYPPPLYPYAYRYWDFHVRTAGEEHGRLSSLIYQLFHMQAFPNFVEKGQPTISRKTRQITEIESCRLVKACESGLSRLVENMLQCGANPDANVGENALEIAVKNGHTGVVKLLIKFGASIKLNANPLISAAKYGNGEIVTELLQHGADIEGVGDQTEGTATALILATMYSEASIVKLLISSGADVNRVVRDGELKDHSNALIWAVQTNNLSIVKLLLSNGAQVNTEYTSRQPLLIVVAQGYTEIVAVLIAAGADLKAISQESQKTAIGEAVTNGNLTIVRMLVAAGAELDPKASRGYDQIIQLLLDFGMSVDDYVADFDDSDDEVEPVYAISSAASSRHESTIRLLLANGANVNIIAGSHLGTPLHAALMKSSDDSGRQPESVGGRYGNPLQAASQGASLELIELILQHEPNVNAEGGFYGSALQAAAGVGKMAAVQLLVDRGANPNLGGGLYGSVLRAAAYSGEVAVVRLLLDSGAKINSQGSLRGGALHGATVMWYGDVVRLLLDNGADINIWATEHGTALQAAMEKKARPMPPGDLLLSDAVANLLLDRGTDLNLQGGFCGGVRKAVMQYGTEEMQRFVKQRSPDRASTSSTEKVLDIKTNGFVSWARRSYASHD